MKKIALYIFFSLVVAVLAIGAQTLLEKPVRQALSPLEEQSVSSPASGKAFVLLSPEVSNGGQLPKDFTGDGTGSTLPLEWSGAPEGTRSFAVIMHHVAPDKTKWYWTIYNIPADSKGLPKNVKGIGILGNNSVNDRTEYAPPHSKGPGDKTYIYTVYALSAPPTITVPPREVNRDVLLTAMKNLILDTAEMRVVYSRPGDTPPPRH
ncbi:MAG: YbhB/YbcL family Raf kinase inhibitor-like protein [Candidatus Riflebacteria bacterium]|nr:YbhB/YbcL family Raf kinase inhibitor-like protein [Candidatus Riflebacteria bacterium]